MVSIEDEDSSDVEILDHTWPKAVSSGKKCLPEPITGKEKKISSCRTHLKSHFVEMGFSPALVDKVIQENGEEDVDVLLEIFFRHTEVSLGASGSMQKKRCLQEMGFTEDEASRAIDNFGPEVQICELADAIFADRIACTVAAEEQKDNQNVSGSLHSSEDQVRGLYQESKEGQVNGSSSVSTIYDSNEIRRKRRLIADGRTASNTNQREGHRWLKEEIGYQARTSRQIELKTEMPIEAIPKISKNGMLLSKPPYLFYGNVVDNSQETWRRLSQFLYRIEPELADTQSFSAFARNEGYIHNLPRSERVHIHPMPPLTIEEVLPHAKKWWPSWDTRKKMCCINPDSKEATVCCEGLEKMMTSSRGMLNKEEIVHDCRMMNLIWRGQHKLSPIMPEEMERVLGYPEGHTDIWGVSLDDRFQALMNCFQVDTLAYHLSVLKGLYPEGVNVLSVFSGIGGAEVALHRLGVHLKHVVSVEPAESNRAILRRWWEKSGQGGGLIQMEDIRGMSMKKLEGIVKEIGGFEMVIGSNPCPPLPKVANCDGSAGVNFTLFNEFVRVYKQVRSLTIGN